MVQASIRASVFSCVVLCAGSAMAGNRDWRPAKKDYDQAREAVEADRGRDSEALAKALAALSKKTTALLKADEAKAVDHLLDTALFNETQSVARMALDGLSRIKEKRATKALAKSLNKAKADQKLLLIRVAAEVRHAPVLSALVKQLKDRDASVRAATCKALANHGEAAKDSAAGPLKRLLKDGSLRVRALAANTLQTITGERPKGAVAVAVQNAETGLPDRFNVDRVAFLIDATSPMAEVVFSDPFAPLPPADGEAGEGEAGEGEAAEGEAAEGEKKKKKKRRPRKKKGEKAKPEPPKPVSPFQIAADLVHKALERMSSDNRIHLARFGRSSRVYKSGFGAVPKKLADIDTWLSPSLSRDVNRNLLETLEPLLKAETAPQQVYLFLGGSPTARGRPNEEPTFDAIRELLWTRDIELHVICFVLEDATQAKSKAQQADRDSAQNAYIKFVSDIAQVSRGASTRIDLARLQEPDAVDDKPKADETTFAKGVDLTKPLSSRDAGTVKKALVAAFAKGDTKAEEFVENVAANPDPRKVGLQLLEGLRGKNPLMARAIARGIARNTNKSVHTLIFKALAKERDAAKQMLLLSASGTAQGAQCTDGLAESVANLKGDPLRMAWYYLSDRPTQELIAAKGKLVRRAKGLEGLAKFYSSKALAKANGKPAPAVDGLVPTTDKLLPTRYVGLGTAFIVDTHRDMEATFWAPPKPKQDDKKEEDPKKSKKKKKKDKKKKDEPKKAIPEPISSLGAVGVEVERALKAIAKSEGKANILTTTGDRWHANCAEIDSAGVAEGVRYLEKARSSGKRDVWSPLRQALGDHNVEEIHLIVSGVPLRSAGTRDIGEFLEKVRAVNRAREVSIQVIYVLPPVSGGPRSVAERGDLLDQMNSLYEPLAKENGGRVIIRSTISGLDTLGQKDAKK